ncbi:MAG: hypothetical protein H6707_01290 [Deltaproteobacteria bacterium]|nr:hypothetical protein [Deltaproteobacteria bacterium]
MTGRLLGSVALWVCLPAGLSAAPLRDLAHAKRLVDGVIARSMPELSGRVSVRAFSHRADHFRAQPRWWSLLPFVKTRYVVCVNLRATAEVSGCRALSVKGAEGVIAHELVHLRDMASGWRGMGRVIGALFSRKKEIVNEHRTDLQAVALGYGKGLAVFRHWISRRLAPKALDIKRQTYYFPTEIAALERLLKQQPALLVELDRSPPISLAEVEALVRRLSR